MVTVVAVLAVAAGAVIQGSIGFGYAREYGDYAAHRIAREALDDPAGFTHFPGQAGGSCVPRVAAPTVIADKEQ